MDLGSNMDRQRRIGLTGGIATGKSTVSRLLVERFGLPVLDADTFARQALSPGSPGAQRVIERYGQQVVKGGVLDVRAPRGRSPLTVDRAELGRIVFADEQERRWLERLVHPLVEERFSAEMRCLAESPVVVLMIPLLFETGVQSLCTEIWLVDCDEQQQLDRLLQRDKLTPEEAHHRIEAQWPLAMKRALADVVINNHKSAKPRIVEEHLATQVELHLSSQQG